MQTTKTAGTIVAPLLGVAVAATIWLLAPALGPVKGTHALVAGVLAGPALTLLVATTVGDSRYLPLAGLSTFEGVGVAALLAEFPREGAVEWLFLGFGSVGFLLLLARIHLGNLRRAASTTPESGRTERLVATVASGALAVRRAVRTVAGSPRTTGVLGFIAGAAFAGTHAFGLVFGYTPLTIGGLVGLFAVVFLPFYVLTDWTGLDRRHRIPDGTGTTSSTPSLGRRLAELSRTLGTLRDVFPSPSDARSATGPSPDTAGSPQPGDCGRPTTDPTGTTTTGGPDDPSIGADVDDQDGSVDRMMPSPEVDVEDLSPAVRRGIRQVSETGRRVGVAGADGVRSFCSDVRDRITTVTDPAEPRQVSNDVRTRQPPEIVQDGEVVVLGSPEDGTDDTATFSTSSRPNLSIADLDPRIENGDGPAAPPRLRLDREIWTQERGRDETTGSDAPMAADETTDGDEGDRTDATTADDPDREQRETVSRRVAEVLYGDDESTAEGDPVPDTDDGWTDQLESPEV